MIKGEIIYLPRMQSFNKDHIRRHPRHFPLLLVHLLEHWTLLTYHYFQVRYHLRHCQGQAHELMLAGPDHLQGQS